jgi:hypothetical protein
MDEKDLHIQNLSNRVNELEQLNLELSSKIEENLKQIHKKIEYNNKNSELEKAIRYKEEEFLMMKDNYENKIYNYENRLEESKNKITYDYEIKIEKIIEQMEEMREKFNKMLIERDRELKNLVKIKQEDDMSYQKEIDKLKDEIDCHKQNILASKY